MMQPRLKHFGWGREGEGLTSAEEAFVFERIEQRFGPLADGEVKPPRPEDLKIETPRLNPPASLPFCSTALYDRAAHTYGKSFPDYVRGLVGDYSSAPDVVAYPRTEAEISAIMDWAGSIGASLTPEDRRAKNRARGPGRVGARCDPTSHGADPAGRVVDAAVHALREETHRIRDAEHQELAVHEREQTL